MNVKLLVYLLGFALVISNTMGKTAGAEDKIEKTPKSLFLIKKIKITHDVGEPQFDPVKAQQRTVINDRALHDFKKFE